jgi:HTH-type transcriptional regulator, sugar sensing transcriptional regulator
MNAAQINNSKNLTKILQSIGLTEKEAKIYIALLELQESQPSIIAKRANIKRSTAYVLLESLKKRGLVSHCKKNEQTFYRSTNPATLLEYEENKIDSLKESLPEFIALKGKFTITPQMSIYEGKRGLIQIMEDTLTTSTELLCWANPTIVFSLLEDYYPSYIETKVKRKIWLRGIFCADKIGKSFKEKGHEELREVYLIPKKDFPFKNEINIYDDKVAIISHEDQVGVIIQNQNIADTQRAIFELGFKAAKMLDKSPKIFD